MLRQGFIALGSFIDALAKLVDIRAPFSGKAVGRVGGVDQVNLLGYSGNRADIIAKYGFQRPNTDDQQKNDNDEDGTDVGPQEASDKIQFGGGQLKFNPDDSTGRNKDQGHQRKSDNPPEFTPRYFHWYYLKAL